MSQCAAQPEHRPEEIPPGLLEMSTGYRGAVLQQSARESGGTHGRAWRMVSRLRLGLPPSIFRPLTSPLLSSEDPV
jgi:hypothetical protein